MAGKAWWQEGEAADHMASPVGKQRETDAGAQLTLAFLRSPGPHPVAWSFPNLGEVFLLWLT